LQTGLYVPGGRNVVQFDQVDDFIKTTNPVNWSSVVTDTWTIIVAMTYTGTTSALWCLDSSGTNQGLGSNTSVLYGVNAWTGERIAKATPANATYWAGCGMNSQADSLVYAGVNDFTDASLSSTGTTGPSSSGQIQIGNLQGMKLLDIACWNKKLSQSERGNMLTYMRTYLLYGTPSTITTAAATAITATSATINGTLNTASGNANYQFRWGTDSLLASYTATTLTGKNNSSNETVSENLTGLIAGTIYYFRLVVETTAGTTLGSILSFTAAAAEPVIFRL